MLPKQSPWLVGMILDGSPLRHRIPASWHSFCRPWKDDRQSQPHLVLIQHPRGIWTQDAWIRSPPPLTIMPRPGIQAVMKFHRFFLFVCFVNPLIMGAARWEPYFVFSCIMTLSVDVDGIMNFEIKRHIQATKSNWRLPILKQTGDNGVILRPRNLWSTNFALMSIVSITR